MASKEVGDIGAYVTPHPTAKNLYSAEDIRGSEQVLLERIERVELILSRVQDDRDNYKQLWRTAIDDGYLSGDDLDSVRWSAAGTAYFDARSQKEDN